MSGRELIPRATVDEIVGHRDDAIQQYAIAREHLVLAAKAMKRAREALAHVTTGTSVAHYAHPHAPEIEAFDAAQVLDPDQFLRVAWRLTDIRVWASVIERTELDHLMDKQAKDELREQMAYVPEKVDRDSGQVINADEIARGLPPVSVDAIVSTLQGFGQDSGAIFRRGLANAFSELDRRFRSHDGFKIGSRVILSNAFGEWGSWNYYRNHRDTLTDIERVFLVLDGKGPRAAYGGIVGTIEADRKGATSRKSVHEGDYFRVRIFKNGNAHLWFTRDDLVRKANKLLAEHYGEVIADGKDRPEDPDAPFESKAMTPAKNFGFYPTPPDLCRRIAEMFHCVEGRILEPSAGTGVLARAVGATDVVEIQPDLARGLEAYGDLGRRWTVHCRDFLTLSPHHRQFDGVAMNPPFDRQRDIDHVRHAWDFLKPGGLLVAIMSAGTEFRTNRKATAFRELMNRHGATWRDLPAGTFAEAGTNVNTLLLCVRKGS